MNRYTKFINPLALAVSLFLPVLTSCRLAPPTDQAAEEYAIYREILSDLNNDCIVINGLTVAWSDALNPGDYPKLDPDLIEDFNLKSLETIPLKTDLVPGKTVILLESGEKAEIFSFSHGNLDDQWRFFHQQYPCANGLEGLSRVGFNSEMDEALVYHESIAGALAGTGAIIRLVQGPDGYWEVEETLISWIS